MEEPYRVPTAESQAITLLADAMRGTFVSELKKNGNAADVIVLLADAVQEVAVAIRGLPGWKDPNRWSDSSRGTDAERRHG